MWELYTGIEQKENTLLLMKEVDGGATVEQVAMGVKCVVIRQNTVFWKEENGKQVGVLVLCLFVLLKLRGGGRGRELGHSTYDKWRRVCFFF